MLMVLAVADSAEDHFKTELSASHTSDHLLLTVALWGMCGHPHFIDVETVTQIQSLVPSLVSGGAVGMWTLTIWLQNPSVSVRFTLSGWSLQYNKEKHAGFQCRVQSMLAPERQYVEWEEHLDRDPETCFPLEWPVGGLAHSLWLCFTGASQSQNEGLDSVLRWSLKLFPVEVFLPTKEVESLKVVLPPRPVPRSRGFMC